MQIVSPLPVAKTETSFNWRVILSLYLRVLQLWLVVPIATDATHQWQRYHSKALGQNFLLGPTFGVRHMICTHRHKENNFVVSTFRQNFLQEKLCVQGWRAMLAFQNLQKPFATTLFFPNMQLSKLFELWRRMYGNTNMARFCSFCCFLARPNFTIDKLFVNRATMASECNLTSSSKMLFTLDSQFPLRFD